MRWRRRVQYRYRPEDSSEERRVARRLDAHREEELRTVGEDWDQAIRNRLDEPIPRSERVRRRKPKPLREGIQSDLIWGPGERAPSERESRAS